MAAFATDPGKLTELQGRLSELERERDGIEERWMELAD